MKSQLYYSLRNTIKEAIPSDAHSTVDLSLVELASGNFKGALLQSEDLIKKYNGISVGWGLKALCQAEIFDHDKNIHHLDSSAFSMLEFLGDAELPSSVRDTIEVLYNLTLLDRTVNLVQSNVSDADRMLTNAYQQMQTANAFDFAGTVSMLGALNSKSSFGRTAGLVGVMGAASAKNNARNQAAVLSTISTGTYGLAVANMSLTIEYAVRVKSSLSAINGELKQTAIETLSNWLTACQNLHNKISVKLFSKLDVLIHANDPLATCEFLGSAEMNQFLYLSECFCVNDTKEVEGLRVLIKNYSTKYSDKKSNEATNDQFIILGIGLSVPTISSVGLALMGVEIPDALAMFFGLIGFGSLLYFVFSKPYDVSSHKNTLIVIRSCLGNINSLVGKRLTLEFI